MPATSKRVSKDVASEIIWVCLVGTRGDFMTWFGGSKWKQPMNAHDTFQAVSYNSLQSSCIHEILWNDLWVWFPELKKSCLIKYSTNLWSPLKTPKCTWVTNWVQICQAYSRREMLEVNREHIVSAFHKSMAREHTHGLRIDLNWRVDQSNFWRPWLLSNMRNMGICSVFCMPVRLLWPFPTNFSPAIANDKMLDKNAIDDGNIHLL